MKAIVAVFIFSLVLPGYASGPSVLDEQQSVARWSPPPFPASPPPLEVKGHFGLPPPRYPYSEKRAGAYGEVLLEIVVDESHHLAAWKVLRATTEGFEKSVLATMSKKGRAAGVPAGVYLYSVVFDGDGRGLDRDQSRPATFWIETTNFGSK
ncbi:MAG: energy transducer TonB [Opitutaceae bacterium]|nr:energy transducer TonB [Opitutaceae bacterium]